MNDTGWPWLETGNAPREDGEDATLAMAEAFARAFRTPDGHIVLRHIMARTRNRALGWKATGTEPLWQIAQDTPYPFTLLSVTTEIMVND